MEVKQPGLSDTVLIEIVHGIKEIILELITKAYSHVGDDQRLKSNKLQMQNLKSPKKI